MEEATLPNELIFEVLCLCDKATVASAGLACKELHEMTRSDTLLLARIARFQPKLFNAVKHKSVAKRFRALKTEYQRLLKNINVWAPGFVIEGDGVGPVYSPSDSHDNFAFSNGTRIFAVHPKDVTSLWHNAICRIAFGPTVSIDVATGRPDAWSKIPMAVTSSANGAEIVKRAEERFTSLKEADGVMVVEDTDAVMSVMIQHARNYSTSCVVPSPIYRCSSWNRIELFEAIAILPGCEGANVGGVMRSWVSEAGRPEAPTEMAAADQHSWYLAWSDRKQDGKSPWVENGFDPDVASVSLYNLSVVNNVTTGRICNYAMMFHCRRPGVLTIVPLQQKMHELLFLV